MHDTWKPSANSIWSSVSTVVSSPLEAILVHSDMSQIFNTESRDTERRWSPKAYRCVIVAWCPLNVATYRRAGVSTTRHTTRTTRHARERESYGFAALPNVDQRTSACDD